MDYSTIKKKNEQQCKRRLFLLFYICLIATSIVLGQNFSQNSKSGIKIETKGFVDLGFPSGTLWATCNIGASRPEEYGEYYAWGETHVKSEYYWENYFDTKDYVFQRHQQYVNSNETGNDDFMMYYPEGGRTSIKGNISYDVATLKYGKTCHIPSEEEFKELYVESSMIPDEFRGVVGIVVQGPNRKAIFIPAGGKKIGHDLLNEGDIILYWLSDLDSYFPDGARCFAYDKQRLNLIYDYYYRSAGCLIRPVKAKP